MELVLNNLLGTILQHILEIAFLDNCFNKGRQIIISKIKSTHFFMSLLTIVIILAW